MVKLLFSKKRANTLHYGFLGRGPGANKLEPFEALCDAILEHWNTEALQDGSVTFDNLLAPAYNLAYEY